MPDGIEVDFHHRFVTRGDSALAVYDFGNDVVEVERAAFDVRAASFQSRDVEHVVDVVQQQAARSFHDFQVVALALGEGGVAHQLHRAEHTVQRCTHLVAHDGHELGAGAFASECLVAGLHQFGFSRDLT